MRLRTLNRSVQKHSGTFVSATDRLIAKLKAEAAAKKAEQEKQTQPATQEA
jgi:hypothetical protein